MAKVLGQSGRYVSQEALNQSRRIMLLVVLFIAALALIEGMVLESYVPVRLIPAWIRVLVMTAILPALWLMNRWGNKKLDALDKKRADLRRGATGEISVGYILADLPDEFCVINDLTTPFGNLDHVIVGPTGVFALDSKSWRGVVSADGKGELLVNGQPTDKPEVRNFIGRMMGIRDKVRALAAVTDVFYQALFVFTAARVEAKWGSTGNVHCIRDDQLHEYIVGNNSRQRLNPGEVQQLAQAFLGLAHMDREFTSAQSRSDSSSVAGRSRSGALRAPSNKSVMPP